MVRIALSESGVAGLTTAGSRTDFTTLCDAVAGRFDAGSGGGDDAVVLSPARRQSAGEPQGWGLERARGAPTVWRSPDWGW